jgi:hypothetical protein
VVELFVVVLVEVLLELVEADRNVRSIHPDCPLTLT